jgi:hypothetical protein
VHLLSDINFCGKISIDGAEQLINVRVCDFHRVPNRNRNLQTVKAPLESQALGTSLFTSAVT